VTGELAFTGTTLGGKPFNAATLAGKPVLLWFWAPWCSVCAAEAPDVLRAHQRHSGELSVLGVAGLDDLDNMQPFVDRTNTGPITHLGDPTGEIWRRFKVTQQSTYVLLDSTGKVTFSGVLGGDELRDKVAELVAVSLCCRPTRPCWCSATSPRSEGPRSAARSGSPRR
jgi:thiol-disulfide isomerase/thioredoxin